MRKKNLKLILITSIAAILLIGCSKKDDTIENSDSSTTAEAPSTSETFTTKPDSEPTTETPTTEAPKENIPGVIVRTEKLLDDNGDLWYSQHYNASGQRITYIMYSSNGAQTRQEYDANGNVVE